MRRLAPALALALTAVWPLDAPACVTGMKCVSVPKSSYKAPYAEGDVLPKGSFNVLLNSTYHGLPASDGSFWYAKAGRHVYKVTPQTFEVIADVTHKARRIGR